MSQIESSKSSCPSTSKVSRNTFLMSIEDHFQRVLSYENNVLLESARSCIPIVTLQINTIKRIRNNQMNLKKGDTNEPEMNFEDVLLMELLNWFKKSFFCWVDCPPCNFCESKTKYSHNIVRSSSAEDLRVEVYKCELCDTLTEFPRYNEPGKLLETRRGRCGEWANCFTLLCRALNYDARFVIDTTDHVWTEVYSFYHKRWLHCDPCENVMDTPLMYEAGWGKKLEYIIAYSKDDVQDVTWRYTSDHNAILNRRSKCSEEDLINTLLHLRQNRWQNLSKNRVKFVSKRICMELVDLMVEKKPGDYEKIGRTSGSLSWRLQRKETTAWSPHVWTLQHKEVCIRYVTSLDTYEVVLPDGTIVETKQQWPEGAYLIENMMRKEEEDWKMVYLAREEHTEKSKISWRVMTDNNTSIIDTIQIKVSSQTYASGVVDWVLDIKGSSMKIPKDRENNFILKELIDTKEFTLTAYLHGSNWQHTQIFRQDINSKDYPFQIHIALKNI